MEYYKTIEDYCKGIGIPKPKHSIFDIRRFSDNMKTVNLKQSPFRHEFFSVAIKVSGNGKALSGHQSNFPTGYTIFFNTPYQVISWDIEPNWEGYYIIFTQDFLARSNLFHNILNRFPFLKIESDIPLEINQKQVDEMLAIFDIIFKEYQSNHSDKFYIIETQVLLLLNYIKRYFNNSNTLIDVPKEIWKTDLIIVSRFESLLESSFLLDYENNLDSNSKLHSTSYYAEKLNIHPNHLNLVVKQIYGQTAKQLIQNFIIGIAKTRLLNSEISIKELAYSLHFQSPNSFSNFFKKLTKKTPKLYKAQNI